MPRIRITEESPIKIKWKDKDTDPNWKSEVTEAGWNPPADWQVVANNAKKKGKGVELSW